MGFSSTDAKRLAGVLAQLLSPEAYADADAWGLRAGRALRDLVSADAAYIVFEGSAPSFDSLGLDADIVRAYRDRYALVDHGIARQRARGLELWTRHMLWRRGELERSEYYHDFALPNRLHDSVGLAASTGGDCVRLSLLYSSPASTSRGESARRQQLRLLEFAWPAFRVGAALSTRWRAWHESLAQIVDRVPQPLALCAATGRVLHENPELVHALALDVRDRLRDAIRAAARAVASIARPARGPQPPVHDVATPSGRWRVFGSRLECDVGGVAPTVLVSIVPATSEAPARGSLRASLPELRERYGLTRRQLDVLELLRSRRSNAEVARELRISEHTARHHTETVLFKLGLHSRTEVEEFCDGLVAATRRRSDRAVHIDVGIEARSLSVSSGREDGRVATGRREPEPRSR